MYSYFCGLYILIEKLIYLWNLMPGTGTCVYSRSVICARLMLLSPLENSGSLMWSRKWSPCDMQSSSFTVIFCSVPQQLSA